MAQHGKKYLEAAKLVDETKLYDPQEAVELLRQTSFVKFDPTIELHFRLGVDPRHADQMVRGMAVLPHGTGRVVRILVFAQGDKAREAEEAGADFVGSADLVKQITEGWLGFDVAIATPDMMQAVGRLGKILGRRGLMPNPKAGTVTMDVARTIREVRSGRVEFRVERAALIHVPVGKLSFDEPVDPEQRGVDDRGDRGGQAQWGEGPVCEDGDPHLHHGCWHPSRHEPGPRPPRRVGMAGKLDIAPTSPPTPAPSQWERALACSLS